MCQSTLCLCVCVCVLKYALCFVPHFTWNHFAFFLFMLYTLFRASNILKLSNFPNGLFVCSFFFFDKLIIIFTGYVLTERVCVCLCVNMIKYFIIYLLFQNVNDVFICVSAAVISFLYVRIHILFRTIWIHVSPISKRKKHIFYSIFELLCWKFYFLYI